MNKELLSILSHFQIKGKVEKIEKITGGLINATYHIWTNEEEYLLQKVNTNIFHDMTGLMNNIDQVTSYLKEKGETTLTVIPATDGKLYYMEYRLYLYIRNSFTFDRADDEQSFYLNGRCFGHFHYLLKDFQGEIMDSIPDFHNTKMRYVQFLEACQKDHAGRKDTCKAECEQLKQWQGLLELQIHYDCITHNDTKLSNILFSVSTGEPICVIDLDTLMKGSIGFDYGDALRSGANTAREDDPKIENVDFDLKMFEAFTNGFLDGMQDHSKELLVELENGLYLIIYEQAIRFLTDYLNGDIYYTIQYPEHNLIRARNQICLLKRALEKQLAIESILSQYE